MKRTWTSHFERLEGMEMTTQQTATTMEATKEEMAAKEEASRAEKLRERARAEEEKRKKEEAEIAAKEPVKAKILRLLAEVRTGVGTARRRAMDELQSTVGALKTEELVGDAEKERKAKEAKKEG